MAPPAFAADLAAGKKAAQCAVCHGQDGIAAIPEAPNLAAMQVSVTLPDVQ